MVSCINNQGEQIWITNARDFQGCMSEDAFNAVMEYFGVDALGTGDYRKDIEELEVKVDNLEYEVQDKEADAENAERDAQDMADEIERGIEDLRDSFQEQYEKITEKFKEMLEDIRRFT